MLTPAQRHFQNVMAQRRGTQANASDFTAYEQMLHRLRLDKVKLKSIQSKTVKAAVKQSLIGSYQGWIDGVLSADTGQSDDVITTLMIWNIDAGNLDDALRIAEYVLRHKLNMPDQFERTPATALVDEICDPVLVAFNRDPRIAPIDVSLLLRLDAMTNAEDMPDPVRAKLFKAIGYSLRLDSQALGSALAYLQQAITLFGKIGVKRDIELLQRAIKSTQEPDTNNDNPESATELVATITQEQQEAVASSPESAATARRAGVKKTAATPRPRATRQTKTRAGKKTAQ
ncbi:phage terminase small subunit [Photorhabdus namnaonensis]|uniref:Phage small terminase subunit n=1 Tax=Photorhabdus namnaonensis TaxID=1851568 RepID=A0A1B8YGG7_9GAMM|nr:phage terminase small subunit [Photorhabdus namnaonensis]OCA54216.1 Phage small terminase subunit [Photorhabdus namnaonensis]